MGQKTYFLKYFLWWLGIIKACPKCGCELTRIDKGGWDLYKCSNPGCGFGKKHEHLPFEIWSR